MNKIATILIFNIICLSYPLHSQLDSISCRLEAIRIQNIYKKYESKYIEIAKEKLLYYLSRDTVLKEIYLSKDSVKFKSLSIRLIPRFNLDYSARDYKWGDNLSKYFIIDTNNLIISVILFLDANRVIFELIPLKSDCDISEFKRKSFSCSETKIESGYTFNQQVYRKTENCFIPLNENSFKNDCAYDIVFEVLGLGYFEISDSTIYKEFADHDLKRQSIEVKNVNLEYFMKNVLTSKYDSWVRYCARHCSNVAIPWWRFWNWRIFDWKPSEDLYQLQPESAIMFQ